MAQFIHPRNSRSTNRRRHSRLNKRIKTVKIPFFIGRYSMMFVLIGFICLLSVIYLVMFNNNATNGYQIQRLEFERNELLTEREQKTLHLSRSQTIEFLKNDSKINDMVNQQPQYIFIDENIAYH